MAKRPTRLRFTEDDLADSHVKKAADRADKAVDRAEKAADKLASKKAKPKLKLETDAAGSRKAKLRFEKAEFTEIERPSVAKHMASRGAAVTLTSKAHRAVSEYEDDNIGVQAVQETTKAVESTVYDLDEINHNPYELAAYLTVKFEDYTRDEVQATLQWLFEQQYELTRTEVVEIRTRTTSSTDPETGETTTEEEDYEYYILNVKLRNKGLNSVISNSGLSEDDMERYRILLQTRGNRPDIFGNDIYATPGGEYTDYDIPGEALTDTRFANMIREAEKYLGYPYVWGGSSPSTSFDCSGFVSYVINHCGNGWSVGRLTANGLMGVCDIIPKSSAKPGDLIFFQGTYDTSGASHVGIYVGNGMMIHCGNPISYASIESNYWQQHFYCFGRIRN